jgi:hypothetical protein
VLIDIEYESPVKNILRRCEDNNLKKASERQADPSETSVIGVTCMSGA